MENAKSLLVDSNHGVYAWHNLASRYPLFVGPKHVPLADYLASKDWNATLETVFHPDNEYWCDHIDFLGHISVQADDGRFWVVQQDEDIWAINPDAVWSDDEDNYVMP